MLMLFCLIIGRDLSGMCVCVFVCAYRLSARRHVSDWQRALAPLSLVSLSALRASLSSSAAPVKDVPNGAATWDFTSPGERVACSCSRLAPRAPIILPACGPCLFNEGWVA